MRNAGLTLAAAALLLGGLEAHAQAPSAGPFDPKTGRFAKVLSGDAAREADTLSVSTDRAWRALAQVYGQLGIALSVVDTESHVLGVVRGVQRRPVGGMRLSQMLECGVGTYGANADHYTVLLTALTAIAPAGPDRSIINTRVGGVASPNGVNSSVSCNSSGALEEKIISLLREAAGK